MVYREPRSQRRDSYDDHTRVTLLEDDADTMEAMIRAASDKLDTIIKWLVVGAISFSTTAILLGVNIAIR